LIVPEKFMKTLMSICLLTLGAAALAQTTPPPKTGDTAKLEADEAKTRAKLEEARKRLDEAAREVAELSTQLGGEANRMVFIERGGPRRAMLGVQIDGDKDGARVLSVSPGGPAEEAGIKDGDIIVAIDGKKIGGENAGRAVVDEMRNVKPDQKVKVVVLRSGKKHDYVVVARPFAMPGNRVFNMRLPDGAPIVGAFGSGHGPIGPGVPQVYHFRRFVQGEFEGLELASITPKLGSYFGTNSGVLVVQAPQNDALKLEDGDVIQAIDGRKPEDGAHALRILRSYKPGEKLTLDVLRQRKPLKLAITMPDNPGPMDDFDMSMPPVPPPPATPAAPPAPAGAAGASTDS
jgi:membrane-associated protease RseP (regulator of RpoE activity)